MTTPKVLSVLLAALLFAAAARAQSANPATSSAAATVETLICIRHGEKTSDELGQLSIIGLNRSLALPRVLLAKYGKPQFVFAPDPAQMVQARDKSFYCYVRPLATIEPTAIFCGLTVNTLFGCRDIKNLEGELDKPAYDNALVFIAWEHAYLEKFVRQEMLDHAGDGSLVPEWKGHDYDSIYLVKVTRQNGHASAAFTLARENLDHLSDSYPGPAPALPPGP